MQEESSNDLFGIRLNETGIHYIRKAAGLAVVIYVLVAITSLLYFIGAARNVYRLFAISSSEGNSWHNVSLKLIACSWFLTIILNIFGAHYFVKFLRSLRRSSDENNEPSFNISFKYIYLNAIIFFWLMIINILFEVFGMTYFMFD